MKRNLVIGAVSLLLSMASISASAQTRPGAGAATPRPTPAPPTASANVPVTKIAVVDTSAFADEKTGIKRYINAAKTVQGQFQPRTAELMNLQGRMKLVADEIAKLNGTAVVAQETIQAKQYEGEALQREFKFKKEQLDVDIQKKYNEAVGPISADIGKALDTYATQQGLTLILDISKLLPAVLTMNPAMDVTQAFIADYNSKNP